MIKSTISITLALSCLVFAVPHARAVTVISDGTFDNSDYATIMQSGRPTEPSGFGADAQLTTGGDPSPDPGNTDAQEDVFQTNTLPASSPFTINGTAYPYSAFGAVINLTDSYDPATEGAIQSLTFNADIQPDSEGDLGFEIFFFVEQNGVLFRSTDNLTPDGLQSDTWAPYAETEMSSSSFFAGNPPASSKPLDFSVAGAPIYFGIGVSYVDQDVLGDGFDLDNFVVNVTSAPEPPMWAMLFLGLSAAGFCVRRKLA